MDRRSSPSSSLQRSWCAVVAEQCAREATFLKPLAEAVNEAFQYFRRLDTTVGGSRFGNDRRAVRTGLRSSARRWRSRLWRWLCEVAVPEGVNVTHLIRASLARNEARILLVAAEFSVFSEAMVLHEPADGGVARQARRARVSSRRWQPDCRARAGSSSAGVVGAARGSQSRRPE